MPKGRLLAALLLLAAVMLPLTGRAETAPERARALLSRGEPDSAMAVIDSSLATDSANSGLWITKAEIHAARSEREQQIAALRTVLRRYPAYPDAIIGLAHACLDSGLVDSAARYLPPILFRPGPHQIEALSLKAQILESQGRADSAIALYERAYEILDHRTLVRFSPTRLQRLNQARLRSDKGVESVWRPGRPSMFLFWADWAPRSLEALGQIVGNLKGSGIGWQFIPINVSTAHPDPAATTKAVSQAREQGYKDTVWIDQNLTMFREWNIDRVPTIMVTGINGDIDAVQSGWSEGARNLIIDQYLGSYTDSANTTSSPEPAARDRARYLIESARAAAAVGNLEQAVQKATGAVKADPEFPLAHVALAVWRWQRGDTLGTRIEAYLALKAGPNDPWANLAVGRVEYLHGHNQSVFDRMRETIAQDSGFVPAWRLLGHCAIALGDTRSAQSAIHAIERYNQLDLELPVLRARITAATDPARAASIWRQVIASHP